MGSYQVLNLTDSSSQHVLFLFVVVVVFPVIAILMLSDWTRLWDIFVWPGTFAFETSVKGIRLDKLCKWKQCFVFHFSCQAT